jgi:hypothetical protein
LYFDATCRQDTGKNAAKPTPDFSINFLRFIFFDLVWIQTRQFSAGCKAFHYRKAARHQILLDLYLNISFIYLIKNFNVLVIKTNVSKIEIVMLLFPKLIENNFSLVSRRI